MDRQGEPVKFRHELKHYINMADYLSIRQRLLVVAWLDKHAGVNGSYRVRSIYFETPDDKSLQEKLNGIGCREKFRIRYYDDNTDFIRLEKKTKIYGMGEKQSMSISEEECKKIITGDTEWMRSSQKPLLLELYAKMQYQQLKAKTVVDYIREPYVYEPGNVRITIDSQIETGIRSRDFFNIELPTLRTEAENVLILEVKYDAFLPDIIRDVIQTKNRRSTAFSKYAAGRIYG